MAAPTTFWLPTHNELRTRQSSNKPNDVLSLFSQNLANLDEININDEMVYNVSVNIEASSFSEFGATFCTWYCSSFEIYVSFTSSTLA